MNIDLILRHWDDLLRIAGSLKQGFVTASLLISKLQSPQQKNALTKALQEYGKLNETIFIPFGFNTPSACCGVVYSQIPAKP